MFLFVIVSIEAIAQLLYRIRYGEFVWRQGSEIFRVQRFTRPVADARHATTIPNFSDPNYDGYGVSIDAYGFRRGAQTTIPDCPSVVFIGDSVPFGWGVPDRASMPSKLFEHLQRENDGRCVINAAIPAYSLFQAVARLEHEILRKFKIDSVYLQIYDPVKHFARFGAQWTPEMDWNTEPVLPGDPWVQKREYVASIQIVRKALFRFGVSETNLDERALDRYRGEIRRELEHLHDIAVQARVKRLIVAPVTVPSGTYEQLPEIHRIALKALNDELKQFATSNEKTTFFDTGEVLKSHPDSKMFIDQCCHLTELGNDFVAEKLIKILSR